MQIRKSILLLLMLLTCMACALKKRSTGSSSSSDSSSSSNTTTTTTPNLSSCTSSVIDTGQKGAVTGVGRGSFSDTKMIPGTSSPVVAYADQSAVVIKLAYWANSQFVNEVVAADGNATQVRLAMLSTGVPIVLWTLGASVKAAVRSAALPNAGTWNAGIIDTGVAPRALEVSVNPLDQVGVSFITNNTTAGRAKFTFCNSPCSSPSGFTTMSPNAYIENTNTVVGVVGTGLSWCKSSDTVYYPAVTHTVTGALRFSICQNATLANCALNTNWSSINVVATASLNSRLLIDHTVTGDTAKVVALGAAGVTPYKMGTTACTAAPAAFSAGTAMGGATFGSQWIQILIDAAAKFHLVGNTSTTSVSYYNSTGTNFTSTWNTVGTAETITLAAANQGSATIDTTNSNLYISYGTNAAPFDLKLAKVNNYTATSNTATYTRYTPDLKGNLLVGAAGSQHRNIAVSKTSAGIPVVAYVDYSAGAVTTGKLKYAIRSGSSSSSAWDIVLVPGPIAPQMPSLVLDSNDVPWISYFDATTNRFYLVTNSRSDGQGSWNSYDFPSVPSGAPVALPSANNTAMALYSSGSTSNPVMIVTDTNATSKGIKAAMFDKTTSSFSSVTTIDGLTGGALGAAHLSAAYDSSGTIVIAYQDLSVTKAKYATSADGSTWSTPLQISSVGHGVGASIALYDGKPYISYFDAPNNTVYYASCSNAAVSCTSGGWTAVSTENAAGVSALTAATGQVLRTSLQFTAAGNPFILYPRGQANDASLVINEYSSSAGWDSRKLVSGINGNLPGASALNYAISGFGVEATKNAVGGTFGAFVGPGNWLYAVSCGD